MQSSPTKKAKKQRPLIKQEKKKVVGAERERERGMKEILEDKKNLFTTKTCFPKQTSPTNTPPPRERERERERERSLPFLFV